MKTKLISSFEGVVYKRGEIVVIEGFECKYSKMVKGQQIFKRLSDGKIIKKSK